jgi:DNA-binding transcriptional LysR family regulator
MELKDLRIIVAVAEAAGFRRAAEHLNVEQSALSRRVRRLEDDLGVSLFERHRGGVRTTHAGREFIDRARRILTDADSAFHAARGAGVAANGKLAIGFITSLSAGFQRQLLASFRDMAPEVRLELSEGERGDLLLRLRERRADVLILTGAVAPIHGDSMLLWREPVHVALPVEHPLAARAGLSWSDLEEEVFLVTIAEPGPEIHDHIVRRLTGLGKRPKVLSYDVGRETLLNLVGMGFGVTMAGESWAGVQYPEVVFRPIADGSPPLEFSAAWQHDNDNPALRRFLSLAREMAKQNAALWQRRDPSP